MNLFELFVKIGAKDEASGAISKISSGLGKGLATAAKVGTAAVTAVTAAAGAMSAAFIKGTSEVAQYGDNIDKMSQKMGLSAEAYQEWDFIMQHSGTSMETLKASMKTLANAVDSGNDAFQRLGISQNEIASLNQEELFARTIEELQKVEDTTERTYLAGQLLGRGATELGALLNTSAEDTEAMRKQVHELGGVMSNEAVKAAAAYQDSLQNMQTAFSGIQRGMLSEFLPSMVTVMDGLALIFSGNDSGIAKITEGVNQFADKLMEAMPKIFELGEGILSSLATAILDNLPTLTTTATKVILQLFEGIVSALPQIAEGAIEIVRSLTQGLSDNLPTIMNSAIELVNVLANGILEMLPEIIKLGLDLIVSLANGIAESLPTLIPTIIDVVLQIVDTLTNPETLSNLFTAALDIILALVDGLINPKTLMNIIEAGIELLLGLVDGIIGAIPELIRAVPKIIASIVTVLIAELPTIISAAIEIVFALINGLIGAIPELVAAIPNLIIGIVNGLLNNLDKIILAAPQIILSLIKGLIGAIPQLIMAIPKVIISIVKTFMDYDWGSIGKNIVQGLKDGIAKMWTNLKNWFKNLFGDLIGIAKKILGIASPSKVFKKLGSFTAEGFGAGFEDAFGDVERDIENALDFNGTTFGVNAYGSYSGVGALGGIGGTSFGTVNINIDGANIQDDATLADMIAERLQRMTERRGAVFA